MSNPASNEELIIIEDAKALDLFSTEGGLDFILDEAKALVDGFTHDISTSTGRKETASLAYKIAKFKTRLDGMGKELTSEWKEKAKLVDNNRKHLRDELDALKALARKPLTDWENAELARKAAHGHGIKELTYLMEIEDATSESISVSLEAAKSTAMGEQWEEFAAEAARVKDEVVTFLEAALEKMLKAEAEAVELDRLRKEEAARQQEARDEAIRVEAADKARADEQRKVRVADQLTKDLARQEEDKRLRREANKSNLTRKNNAAIKSIVACGISEADATTVVTAIAAGQIKNVSITY